MKKLNSVGFALLALLTNSAFANTLNASQVGNISVNNYSSSPFYLTVNWWDGSHNIGLLQFDLSAYAGVSVSNAMLNLYHQYNDGNGAIFALYENTSAWNIQPWSSWGDAPSHLANPTAYLNIGDDNQGLWRSVDVTNAVNDWTSGSLTNYGFTLERIDQSNPFVYFTGNNEWGGHAPTLDIDGATPSAVPLPAALPLMLSGLGILGFASRRRGKTEV